MDLERRHIAIGGGAAVSAVIAHPAGDAAAPPTAVILAHGAGNDMQSPFLCAMHEGLAARGYVCVKFNFPYKERGGRAPDPAAALERCYTHVLEAVRDDRQIAAHRIVIGGKSLGGRMASHLAAKGANVDGLLFLGYPLHPPGRFDQLRVAHLDKIRAPMLFFAGTRDALCRLDLLKQTLARLTAPVTLHVIDGGDHSFKVLKKLGRDESAIWEEIIATSAHWLESVTAG